MRPPALARQQLIPGAVESFVFNGAQRPDSGETISVGELLKLEGVIRSGAEIKTFLTTVPVCVNGEREARRGRRLHLDDVVRVGELGLTSATSPITRPLRAGEGLKAIAQGPANGSSTPGGTSRAIEKSA